MLATNMIEAPIFLLLLILTKLKLINIYIWRTVGKCEIAFSFGLSVASEIEVPL